MEEGNFEGMGRLLALYERIFGSSDAGFPPTHVKEVSQLVDSFIAKLSPVEQIVIRRRFCLDGTDYVSLRELGEEMGLSTERIRQIELKALRKLRHPKFSQLLRVYLIRPDLVDTMIRNHDALYKHLTRIERALSALSKKYDSLGLAIAKDKSYLLHIQDLKPDETIESLDLSTAVENKLRRAGIRFIYQIPVDIDVLWTEGEHKVKGLGKIGIDELRKALEARRALDEIVKENK